MGSALTCRAILSPSLRDGSRADIDAVVVWRTDITLRILGRWGASNVAVAGRVSLRDGSLMDMRDTNVT